MQATRYNRVSFSEPEGLASHQSLCARALRSSFAQRGLCTVALIALICLCSHDAGTEDAVVDDLRHDALGLDARGDSELSKQAFLAAARAENIVHAGLCNSDTGDGCNVQVSAFPT